MRILVVHQYYLEPGAPGGSRFNELSHLWAGAGHEVTVVAGTINYLTSRTSSCYRGRWITRVQDGPVTVLRCYVPESYGRKGYLGRGYAFLVFVLSGSMGVLAAARPDVVVVSSPPLTVFLPGWLGARLWRVPLVFEIRDLWPESAVTTGVLRRNGLVCRLLYALERWACRTADRINVLTPAFRDDLLSRGLAASEKIAFIPNGADVEALQPRPPDPELRRRLGWGDRFVLLYAGAHGRANALYQLLDAAACLRDRPDILIATVGDGPELVALKERASCRGLNNVIFHGPWPRERIAEVISACDAGAAVLQKNPTFHTVYPNKVFDYMACGRPIVVAIDGVARRLVCDEARAGVFAEPECGHQIASAVCWLADNPEERKRMGRAGREWVTANASRQALAAQYLKLLEELRSRSAAEGQGTRSRLARAFGAIPGFRAWATGRFGNDGGSRITQGSLTVTVRPSAPGDGEGGGNRPAKCTW